MATDRPAPAGEAAGCADGPPRPPEAPPRPSHPDKPPAEPRSRAELYTDLRAADQPPGAGRPTDDAHTTPDGGWSWKGLRLDPVANHVADQQLAARRAAEGRHPDGNYDDHGLTPALRRVEAQLDHGTLVPDTEKFALKSPDRFKEKLAKMMTRYPDQLVSDLASVIHDGNRYTFLFPGEHYAAGVAQATRLLTDRGHRLELRKPSWDGDASYHGVNCRWSDAAVQFEIQFHTPESWEAKQKTHDVYEKQCDLRTSPEERSRLEREQCDIATAVPVPAGALEIEFYKRGGGGARG